MKSATAKYSRARIERLRTKMEELALDALYIRDTSNIAWVTAFQNVFDMEQAHAAYIDKTQTCLHTDSRYIAALNACAKESPWVVDGESMAHARWMHRLLREDTMLGIEDYISLGEFRDLEKELLKPTQNQESPTVSCQIKETSGVIKGLRSVKDSFEIDCMKAAQALTDAAFAHICSVMRPGMTERQVQIELEDYIFRNGGDGLAFASIVATGANGANPHAIPGDARLEAGQCVVMDFGARVAGYCSDMTRMVFIGQPSQRIRQAYQVLRDANEQVEAFLKPGVTGAAAQRLAEEILADGGFAGKMGHALGHGVGLDVHESPVLAHRNEDPLVTGNVVTVEPGIYFEGEFGMRLEDFGVISENGFEIFTKSSHDMVII